MWEVSVDNSHKDGQALMRILVILGAPIIIVAGRL